MAARFQDPTRYQNHHFVKGLGDLEVFREWNLHLANFLWHVEYATSPLDSRGLDLAHACPRVRRPGRKKVRNWKMDHNLEMRLLIQRDGSGEIFSAEMILRNKNPELLLNFQWMRVKGGLQPVLLLLFVDLMRR